MWNNPKLFYRASFLPLFNFLTQSVEKSCLIDPLNTNNSIYHDLITLKLRLKKTFINSKFSVNKEETPM